MKNLFNLSKIVNVFQFFANSIAKAVGYIREPDAIYGTLKLGLLTIDLEAPNSDVQFVGTDTISYQHISFGDNSMGTFNRSTGYTAKDMNSTWKTLVLTQDCGDSIKIDRMDDEESCANGIIKFANRYILTIQAPTIDKYRFGVITGKTNIFCRCETPTASTILDHVLHAKARLEEARVDTTGLILYINPNYKAGLKAAALTKGYYATGNWNGILEAEVEMIDGMKVVGIPSSLLGAGICFIVLNVNAVWAKAKYQETEFFDKVPGFGKRKMQADIGVYHDCFVYDELTRAVFVARDTASAYTVVDVSGYTAGTTSISGKYLLANGVYTLQGASAKYASGDSVYTKNVYTVTIAAGTGATTVSAITQASVAADEEFILPTPTSSNYTLSGKTIAGWSDGYHFYNLGQTYVMPRNNVTLTLVWK